MNKCWITDPVSKRKSVTLTSFVIGYGIALLKLIFGGFVIHGITVPAFTGFEFSAAVTALGGIYVMRRSKSGQAFGQPDEITMTNQAGQNNG